MLSNSRRYLLVIALLLLAVAFSWGQRWTARANTPLPPATPAAADPAATGLPLDYIYFVDVEGWYRITPHETVVRSAYDLSGATTEDVAQSLPAELGVWRQVGEDQNVANDPAVVYYLKNPTVALQRKYEHPSGQVVTLAIIGNTGDDSR